MSRQVASSARREDGTASVELIAVVPFVLLAVLVAAQIALAGYALWSAGVAARVAARAALVGGDPAMKARKALPPLLRRGVLVREEDGVAVRVRVPRLLPGLPPLTMRARTRLGDGDDG